MECVKDPETKVVLVAIVMLLFTVIPALAVLLFPLDSTRLL